MSPDHAALLQRLEQFNIDDHGQLTGFTARLARENGWSVAYARRVCREYQRFTFLCVASGRPCTPSDQVDQAWHLHLLHTREYDRFCSDVLRAPLDHVPTRGGARETSKFVDWYESTLRSYASIFGAAPPHDIWPPSASRFGTRFVRVDRNRHWLIPKPDWSAGLPLGVLGLGGCAMLHELPPFHLPGPNFIVFFLMAWAAAFGLAALVRRAHVAASGPELARDVELDAYGAAYLSGGAGRLTHTIVSGLVEAGMLEVADGGELRIVGSGSGELHPLEERVFDELVRSEDVRLSWRSVRQVCAPVLTSVRQRLLEQRLLCSRAATRTWLCLALSAPLLGAVKVGIGIALSKPVAILVVLCVMSTGLAVLWFGREAQRTAAGDAALEQLRARSSVIPDPAKGEVPLPSLSAALGVALFGAVALEDRPEMSALHAALATSDESDHQAGGGGCSGCSGGGCGGGCGGCGGCGGE